MKTPEQAERDTIVIVDVQNDFINGSLAVTNGADVIPPINDVAGAIRDNGGQVILTRDWHPSDTPHFNVWPPHCVANTPGAGFHPDLTVSPTDIILSKGLGQTDGYSGWEGASVDGQTLESIITPSTKEQRVRVFLGGIATDYCVKATVLDVAAHFKDDTRIELFLLRDAIRAVELNEGDEDRAIAAMITNTKVLAISCDQARAMIAGDIL